MSLFSKSKMNHRDNRGVERRAMVREQIAQRGIADKAVLAAMRKIPRHQFVAPALIEEAYRDSPLPIECGQTISQPYLVATMSELLRPQKSQTVLEVGTGSGYQTAILAETFDKVVTVEYFSELSQSAQAVLQKLGYDNISFHVGDGLVVPDDQLRYDAIIVTAAPAQFPESLSDRLKENGRMVIPVGTTRQDLYLVKKDHANQTDTKNLFEVRFVPLLG